MAKLIGFSNPEGREQAINHVAKFLDVNYDVGHDCGDADCPGNFLEAGDIVRTVLIDYLGFDPEDWGTTNE